MHGAGPRAGVPRGRGPARSVVPSDPSEDGLDERADCRGALIVVVRHRADEHLGFRLELVRVKQGESLDAPPEAADTFRLQLRERSMRTRQDPWCVRSARGAGR